MKKRMLLIPPLLFIVFICYCSKEKPERGGGPGGEKPGRPVIEAVERVDLKDVVSNTGTLEPVVKVELQSEASGRIDTIYVREGAVLNKDDIILKIDPERLETRHQKLSLQVQKARLDESIAKRDYENAQKLVEYGKVSENKLQDLKSLYELKNISVREKELELRDVNTELANTVIRAPMDGVLIALLVEAGEIVASATSGFGNGTQIGTVADVKRLEVVTEIGEVDYPKLKLEMSVDISMASDPTRMVTGSVKFISMAAKQQENSMVSNFEVRIALDSLLDGMVPGVNVNVDFVLMEKPDVLGVSYSMVNAKKKGGKMLYTVLMAESRERRRIQVGETDYKYYEVLSGLTEGEKVMKVPERGNTKKH